MCASAALVAVDGVSDKSQAIGGIVVGSVAPYSITFGNGSVGPRRVSPRLRGWVLGGINLVAGDWIGRPPSVRLRFAIVPAAVITGFAAVGGWIVRPMLVCPSIGGTLIRGSPVFRGGGLLVVMTRLVLSAEREGKVTTVGGLVTLRGMVNSVLLGLVERAGR